MELTTLALVLTDVLRFVYNVYVWSYTYAHGFAVLVVGARPYASTEEKCASWSPIRSAGKCVYRPDVLRFGRIVLAKHWVDPSDALLCVRCAYKRL